MSLKSRAAQGMKWQAIELGGVQALGLFVFTALARLLDPSAFGLLGLVAVYLAFVEVCVDQGIGTAIIQRKELDPEHLNAAFWFNVLLASIMCAATIVLAAPVARFFQEPALEPLLKWASLSLVINATATVPHVLFFRSMDYRRPALRTLVGKVVGGIVGVAMALTGWGVWSLIGQQLTGAAAGAAFLWAASPWRPSPRLSFLRLRELLGVSLSIFGVSFLWFFSSRLDHVIIGRFLGAGVLGQYVIGGKLPQLAKIVVERPVAAVSLPALSQLQDDHARMCQVIYKGMELNAAVSFAVFVGLAAVAGDLVPFAFGAKWDLAGAMCALLALYALVNTLQTFFHSALVASGGPGAYILLNICHAAGVAIACAAGIRYGASVLVAGLIVNGVVMAIPSLLFLRRRIGLSAWHYCRPCLEPLLASLLMVGAVFFARWLTPEGVSLWLRLSVQILAGAATYITSLALLSRRTVLALVEVASRGLGRNTGEAATALASA